MCKHVVRMRGIAGIDEIEILTQLIKVGEHLQLHRGMLKLVSGSSIATREGARVIWVRVWA